MLGFGIFGRIKRSTFVRTPKDPCSTGKLGCGPHRRWHRHAAPTPACWRAGLFSDYFSGIPTTRALGVQNCKILTVRTSYLPHNGESEILSQKATRAPAALRSRGGVLGPPTLVKKTPGFRAFGCLQSLDDSRLLSV